MHQVIHPAPTKEQTHMTIITDERCLGYAYPGHPERPARVRGTLDLLRNQHELELDWEAPLPAGDDILLQAHSREHVERVRNAASDFDGDTPAFPDIFDHARRSVGGALQALKVARAGRPAFSLLRPPGHHATRDRAMGFCYFNSIALVTLEALKSGSRRVAVFDFDVHHGNGTEAILVDHPEAAFFSIHQHPCYPGTGTKNVGENCFNYPVAPRTPRAEYLRVVLTALEKLQQWKPDLVAVSAGFDAYVHDPIAQETLEEEDFHKIGAAIRQLNVPVLSVLEGGYSDDLPRLILAYLKGCAGIQ